MSAVAARLPDGRLHLQHGPIDLILSAEGPGAADAYAAAQARFATVLAGLVAELPRLRDPSRDAPPPAGPVARRMVAAVAPHQYATFVTPMAAVAGAVADETLAAMISAAPRLTRALVNNGGDIALRLAPGATATIAMAQGGRVTVRAGDGVGGVATSGRGGRSLSLGIADAVTALADCAAAADAAATLIANAVDLPDHPAVRRAPAVSLRDNSDLGARPATVEVGALSATDVDWALNAGVATAAQMTAAGLIEGAALFLRGAARTTGVVSRELLDA